MTDVNDAADNRPAPVIVTGGGGAIGRAIAARFARAGHPVAALERDAGACAAATAWFEAAGLRVTVLEADVGDPAAAAGAIAAVARDLGRPGVLVNNAAVTGLPAKAAFLDTSDEFLIRLLAVNLTGPFVCSREAGRHMAARGGGVIINIGSIASHAAQRDASAYTVSKAALTGLTRAAALELGPLNIRVVQVDPGDIQTVGSDLLLDEVAAGRVASGLSRGPAVGRRGSPDDIAATVYFLCSPEAGYISGTQVVVDGGYLCG
jgi:NAD(P)-dependent dehydrogenase (short-subunit alcohol dehydrogenase family)